MWPASGASRANEGYDDNEGPDDQLAMAERRTSLARQRSMLAWWRTGLGTLAVAIGVGQLVPRLAHLHQLPLAVLGTGYGVLALILILVGTLSGRPAAGPHPLPAQLERWGPTAITAFLLVLGICTIVMLFAGA